MAGRANRRGFGYVRKLPSRRYQASYSGPDLARHTAEHTFQTKAEAEGWLGQVHKSIVDGTWGRREELRARQVLTFQDFATGWLRDRPLKPRTRHGYQHLLDKYLAPTFGPLKLEDITPTGVRAWWSKLDPTTPTVNARAYALLKSIFNTAVEDELMTANPCRIRAASNPKRARSVRPATLEELDTITEAMPNRFRAGVILGAWCALRIGEILELRRKDIDLDSAAVNISRAVSWLPGGPVVGTPKSAAGTRTVAIPPHILPDLRRHLADHVDRAPDSLLFPSGDGGNLQPSVFHTAWRKAACMTWRASWLQVVVATVAVGEGSGSCRFSAERSGS